MFNYTWTFLLLDERGLRQVMCWATYTYKLVCRLCCVVPKGGTTISPTTYLLLTCLSSCKTVLLPKSARNRILVWNDNALICYVRMLIIACCMQISPRKCNLSGRLWKFMWQRVPKEDTVLIFFSFNGCTMPIGLLENKQLQKATK